MISAHVDALELMEFHAPDDETRRCRATWPLHRDLGTASSAMVYFELEPGKRLGEHTDSAEEVLVVLEGEVEAVVGNERARLSAGGTAVVPAQLLHDVRNVGVSRARVMGIFPSNTIVSVFGSELAPVGSRVVGTPPPAASLEAVSGRS